MSELHELQQAVSKIQSGQRVFVHGGAATPNALLNAIVESRPDLRDVEFVHLHTIGPALYAREPYRDRFKITNLFVGGNMRAEMHAPNVDYLPCFLSEIPSLFRDGHLPIDVALVHVSPPDAHGYCSLGVSVDVALAAVQTAKTVIAQVNPRMPRVQGDGIVPFNKIHWSARVDQPLPEERPRPPTEIETRIGRNVAELIEDGSTLQAGIGSIPDAVLAQLRDRRHLGVHTEMWSNGMLDLIECGAVDNSLKRVLPGKCVSAFVIGDEKLYKFVDDNPSVVQLDAAFVNRADVIARNPKAVSINSAIEIDLTGQVCADSIGSRVISGVGGQMDFVRGATLSKGGQSIIALPSRTKDGSPRIVPTLRRGAGVVTTRAHVHTVATEWGVAQLWGKTLRDRAKAMIAIAHPEDREGLERSATDP